MRIGLTGGIASGKSTVATMFSECDVAVIDSDLIARELVMPGQPALKEIAAEFGASVLDADGQLDRQQMRALVFADPAMRHRLEAILHPPIRATMLARAKAAEGPYRLLVIPLLFETGMQTLVDRVLVVDCPQQLQLERLTARDGSDETTARQILAAQISRSERLAGADDVLVNADGLDRLRAAVARLDRTYRALAA
ncbi:MAG: dephospho-CoA kinase [Gammaproteobacteria bacterium]|nr:dephospho-CoA kinase [Gammaproteobacteria bacterium]NNF62151.1 dephospho-CoA kinase [Gammaproteobacteria bacterium]NNM21842.1 dephospho-CoA kinase [Gammaproteobacteria bacterium]